MYQDAVYFNIMSGKMISGACRAQNSLKCIRLGMHALLENYWVSQLPTVLDVVTERVPICASNMHFLLLITLGYIMAIGPGLGDTYTSQ